MGCNKSMADVAFELMSGKKRAIAFAKLWAEVSRITGMPNDKISQFYSDITLDGRFVSLKDNKWDLKSRRTFAETQFDLASIELDEETEIYNENGDVINEPEENY